MRLMNIISKNRILDSLPNCFNQNPNLLNNKEKFHDYEDYLYQMNEPRDLEFEKLSQASNKSSLINDNVVN